MELTVQVLGNEKKHPRVRGVTSTSKDFRNAEHDESPCARGQTKPLAIFALLLHETSLRMLG